MASLEARIKRWSDEKLDRELAFAELAVTDDHPETQEWLDAIRAEQSRREASQPEAR
jgi:hypothetical protein